MISFFLNNAVSLKKNSKVLLICATQNDDDNTRNSTNSTGGKDAVVKSYMYESPA